MMLKLFLVSVLTNSFPGIATIAVFAVAKIIQYSLYIFIIAIIIRAISSWFMPYGGYNPVLRIIDSITEPILSVARRLLPNIGGIDLSPILVIIFLQLTERVLVSALIDLARTL